MDVCCCCCWTTEVEQRKIERKQNKGNHLCSVFVFRPCYCVPISRYLMAAWYVCLSPFCILVVPGVCFPLRCVAVCPQPENHPHSYHPRLSLPQHLTPGSVRERGEGGLWKSWIFVFYGLLKQPIITCICGLDLWLKITIKKNQLVK